jgi:CobQ-like glutamine amidotransferase family enzyme
MSEPTTSTERAVRIVQLYPEELGVAGDAGNVMALERRLEHAGRTVELIQHRVGETFPDDVDLVIVGNGPLSAMRNVYDDLIGLTDTLAALQASGAAFFAYGSGAELLGHAVHLLDGTSLAGLGLLPVTAKRVTERKVGYVIVDSPFGQIVGFEDNASTWSLDHDAKPFGLLIAGGGNGEGAVEGVLVGSAIGTQVGGPVLPLNPLLTDTLIGFIAERRGFAYQSAGSNAELDHFAEEARAVIVANAKHVFSRI